MDDETTPRPSESLPNQPDSSAGDECRLDKSQEPISGDPTFDSVTVACALKRLADGRLMVAIPLKAGGGELCIVDESVGEPVDLKTLVTLPIKDLANPQVALVVRPSLERLVRAARRLGEHGGITVGDPVRCKELSSALEPFKDVAP